MDYNPRLDNNYRVVDDRIISERQHQMEAAGAFIFSLSLHPILRLIVVAPVCWVTIEIIWIELHASALGLLGALLCAAGTIIVATFTYFLAALIVYCSAAWLTYHLTDSPGLAVIVLVSLPFVARRWPSILAVFKKNGASIVDT